MRDYETMRSLLTFISKSNELSFDEFSGFIDRSTMVEFWSSADLTGNQTDECEQ